MNRTFDFYEYAGIIVPGAILTLGLLYFFPEGRALFAKDGITFGELGLFVIVAYAAGHVVQGVGNWLEWAWWKLWGGIPSRRVLAGKLLSAEQHRRLVKALQADGKIVGDIKKSSSSECLAIVREVYSVVAAADKTARIDTFNGNYGLLRGLAASFVVLLAIAILTAKSIYVFGALAAFLFLAIQRMHRFGKHYALELFIQYILVSRTKRKVGRVKAIR